MKRIFILLVIATVAFGAFAAENTLIDFTLLTSDVTVGEGDAARPEHERTLVDFAEVAGASFTEEERGLMKSSLFIENWEVDLNSSAQSAMTQANSQIRLARVRDDADPSAATRFSAHGSTSRPSRGTRGRSSVRRLRSRRTRIARSSGDGEVVEVQGDDIGEGRQVRGRARCPEERRRAEAGGPERLRAELPAQHQRHPAG